MSDLRRNVWPEMSFLEILAAEEDLMIRPRIDEDHCWNGLYSDEDQSLLTAFYGERTFRARAALLLIDLYEEAFAGIARGLQIPASVSLPVLSVAVRMLEKARSLQLPVLFTTNEARPEARLQSVTQRAASPERRLGDAYRIHAELERRPSDVVIYKTRASGFFGTPLDVILRTLDVRTLVVLGESTSGCVRATVVDAYSHGFAVLVVEDGVFDRSNTAHCANLFDMHHKYATVLKADALLDKGTSSPAGT